MSGAATSRPAANGARTSARFHGGASGRTGSRSAAIARRSSAGAPPIVASFMIGRLPSPRFHAKLLAELAHPAARSQLGCVFANAEARRNLAKAQTDDVM